MPGAFELPLAAKRFAESGTVDAVVCIGAVIRGETAHFEYVAGECAAGVTRASLDTGIPIVFGVLTVEDRKQAFDRVGGSEGHKGEEAAVTAIEMVVVAARDSPGVSRFDREHALRPHRDDVHAHASHRSADGRADSCGAR